MPTLNFKKEFVPLIESGKKRQTVRAFRKDGRDPKKGNTLYLYTGMRTKSCRKLKEAICIKTETIYITYTDIYTLDRVGDKKILSIDEKYELAKLDGFNYIDDFRNFFLKTYGLPFKGLLIKW